MDLLKSNYVLAIKEPSKVDNRAYSKEYCFDSLSDCFDFIRAMDQYYMIDCAIHEVMRPAKDLLPMKLDPEKKVD